MARPKKDIDQGAFENLCRLQCTLEEISGFLAVSEDTIERWCKRQYKARFADIYKNFSAHSKISLRRTQFKMSRSSTSMAIWLGKQYLGQADKVVQANTDPAGLKRIDVPDSDPRHEEKG